MAGYGAATRMNRFSGGPVGAEPRLSPQIDMLDAGEQEAVGFAIGVLSAHAGDTRLDPRVRDAFAEHAGRLQQLLDRAKLSLNH